MDISIRKIGNSKGVIIPDALLKQVGIEAKADIRVEAGSIILKPVKNPRANWLENIQKDPPNIEEELFMEGVEDNELLQDWQW